MPARYEDPPPLSLDAERTYTAVLHTECGDIEVALRADLAPQSVNSFVFLARERFYEGSTFHRVIPGFIAQGGDPTGNGTGGPGYRLRDELSDASFEAGAVGLANAGPHSNGSQFFIVLNDATHLDGRYTYLGAVTAGLDVARALAPREPGSGGNLPPGDGIVSVDIIEA